MPICPSWATRYDEIAQLGEWDIHAIQSLYGPDRLVNGRDIDGAAGADALTGGDGADWLNGFKGPDLLEGGDGQDILRGGKGHDTLIGGYGDDTLYGGMGNNLLQPGPGRDTIVMGAGADTVTGFDITEDRIEGAVVGHHAQAGGVLLIGITGTVWLQGVDGWPL